MLVAPVSKSGKNWLLIYMVGLIVFGVYCIYDGFYNQSFIDEHTGEDGQADSTLYFILGSDSFSQIATWEHWQDLVDLVHLVVLHRAHMWGEELEARVPARLRSRLQVVEPFEEVSVDVVGGAD